jgi:hypothetical protein
MKDEGRQAPRWSYADAFSRHLGLLSAAEQERLRTSRVSIVGMGGVGGVHLITLARLGVGKFTIADPDRFDVANFNRQYGAKVQSLGRPKAEVMAEEARAINPELDLRVFSEPISAANADAFLDGANVFVDGIDFFALDVRRMLFREARRRGLWAVTAAPLGFSTAWLTFSPTGMTFDDYFAFEDCKDRLDHLIAFLMGLSPRATQRQYMDMAQADPSTGRGPSAGLACQLCSGVASAEVLKVLLGRPGLEPAPCYLQFDAYRHLFRRGKMWWGNRNPLQRLKRRIARRMALRLGWQP